MIQANDEPMPAYQRDEQKSYPPARRKVRILLWCAVALASAFGVFVLPFRFPPSIPTFSDSYAYGFNNRVAQLSAVGISGAVMLLLWFLHLGRTPPQPASDARMPRRWLIWACVAAILFVAILGGAMVRANVSYSDASYVLTQLGRVLHDHSTLYRDVEYPYGPILFYWPAAIQKALALAGVGPSAAYMVTLALMQCIGICMLFYILEWLPLSRYLRGLTLGLFTFATLTPLLGINYTLLRFLLPHTVFLAIVRRSSLATQAVLFVGGELLALGFSPEIGVAFFGAVVWYALYRCFTHKWTWIIVAASPFVASVLFGAFMSRSYFKVMGNFAIGSFNIIVAPDFHILVLLVAAIALSPIVVAGYLQSRDPRAAAMLGFYIISLAMMVPALGRCDSLHTFFGGLGVYLLSLVAVTRLASKWATSWVLALMLAVVFSQVEDFVIYQPLIAQVVQSSPGDDDGVDMARLEALTHGERIAAPFEIPQRVSSELIRRGEFQPSYFVYMGGVWDDSSEGRKVAELRQAPFALIPNDDNELTHDDMDQSRRLPVLHTHIPYRPRFQAWIQGALIDQELHDHWAAVGSVGDYTVYHQIGK
jgi:hypothetical protein